MIRQVTTNREVAAVGLFGGYGRSQNVATRRDALNPSRIKGPYFINANAVPKIMMPIATVPVSQIFVEKIREAGIDQIFATTHYLHDIISRHYLEGEGKRLRINELWYENIAMGTAPGAIINILIRPSLREKTIMVFGGDIITDIDIAEALRYHSESGSKCTVALNPVTSQEVSRSGTALLTPTDGPLGEIKEFREKKPPSEALRSTINGQKMFLNNSSVYIFEPELFLEPINIYDSQGALVEKTTILEKMFPQIDSSFLKKLKAGKINVETNEEAEEYLAEFVPHNRNFNDFGINLFPQLAKNGLMKGYFFDNYWRDVGNNESYWFANWHALTGRFKMNIPFPQVLPGVWKHPNAKVSDMRSIEPPVVIGKDVKIDSGSEVGPFAIIDRGWELEENVRISHSVLWRKFAIGEGYPEGRHYQVVRAGAVIKKCFIAGILPVPDHLFKILMGDGRDVSGKIGIRTFVPLKVPEGSDEAIAKQTKRLLILDNFEYVPLPLATHLQKAGWERIETARSSKEADQKLASQHYDLIIMDFTLSSKNKEEMPEHVQLLKEYKLRLEANNHGTPVLFLANKSNTEPFQGLSQREVIRLTELGVVLRAKTDKEITKSKISDFLLKKLLKIE